MSQHAARTGRSRRPAGKAAAQEPDSERAEPTAESAEPASAPVAVGGLAVTESSPLRRSSEDAADPLGGSAIPGDIVSALRRQAGRGAALPDQLASQLGPELGGDVSAARLHTDAEADTLARSVSAVAFTHGTDIYFSAGSFDPGTPSGQHLLAHELSHVVQAQQGTGGDAQGTIGNANDPAERAADASATKAVSALRRTASAGPDVAHEHTEAAVSVGRPADVRRTTSRTSRKSAGSGRVRLSVSAPHDDAAGAHPAEPAATEAIRRLLVKLKTARVEQSKTRVITEVQVEGRAPTTVSGSQGDHTVAETLIVQAVRGICHLQEYWPAYLKLLQNIPTFAQENKVDRYDAEQVYIEFSKTDEKTFRDLDPEDQVASIEAMIDALIRAANKVRDSAFAKKEKLTSGGGKEKEAINAVRELAVNGPLTIPAILMIAEQLVELIDYVKFDQTLADKCVTAIQLACSAAPPLSTKQSLLVPALVDALMKKRFPQLVGGPDILLQAVSHGLGQSMEEVKLSEWGSKDAKQNPKEEESLFSPEFEDKLSEHGSPPPSQLNTTPMPTPKVLTKKLQVKAKQTWGNGQIVQLTDGLYLIVNAVSSSSGQTTYDAAKLQVHQEPVTNMNRAGPELWAFIEYNGQPHQIVHIERKPKATTYYLALVG